MIFNCFPVFGIPATTVNSLSKAPGICFYSDGVYSNLETFRTITLWYNLGGYSKESKYASQFLNEVSRKK